MPEVVDIAEETKKYDREWLLFEVSEVTEEDLPVRGRLLFHCKSREEIHEVAMKCGKNDVKITFAGDPIPPGMVAVL